ncbi:hypothetical protein MKX03_027272 [Papaver bracteatum]|nr:hypothetical protein MKX03_027272 [Papaver bracteatum]
MVRQSSMFYATSNFNTGTPRRHALSSSTCSTTSTNIVFKRGVISLRTKLTKGKYKLLVEPYAAEFIFYYALEKKDRMLRRFSTMLSDASLPEEHKKWICDQEDEDNAGELLSYALENIKNWDRIVNELEKDVQSEIGEEKKRKGEFLEMIHLEGNEFQADNFVKKKEEFEELNDKISSTEKLLDTLYERSTTYYETLRIVGDRSTLEKAFFKLLPPAKEDLAILWYEETEDMKELVRKEEEQEKKAIEIWKLSWSQVIGSSGHY